MGHFLLRFCFLVVLISTACEDERPRSIIPFVPVDATLNLKLQENIPLLVNGGYVYYQAGYKGLIIYRESEKKYIALERACSYQPEKPCEKVKMDDSGFFLIDECCGSTFDLSGNPTGEPAAYPLLQYNTYLDGDFLIIRNQL